MARCEDFPCCGHELGCCPDYGPDGRQLNMVCTCGAKLPIDNPVSICDGCLDRARREEPDYYDEDWERDYRAENPRDDDDWDWEED